MSKVEPHDEHVPEEVACLAWNHVRDEKCRHFDHVCLVSMVDGNGNTILNLDRRFCDYKAFRTKIKDAINGKVFVGYNLGKFLRLMNLDHPLNLSRNLVYFAPFVKKFWSQKSRPSLEEIAQEILRVTMRGKMSPGSVKSAEIVLDLWNLMQMYESARRSEKVLSARFLIHATKDVVGLLFRRVNFIRKAGLNPTGIQVARLTENHFERIVGINFSSIGDLGKVVDQMIRELGNDSPDLRLLVHKNMIGPVESRRSVLSSLYQTSITVFPAPAPGSAEHVVLLQGTRAGMVKTLEMIMKMSTQLENESPKLFYTFHKDFYDAANADSATAEDYGGFGKRIPQPTLPPVHSKPTVSHPKRMTKAPMKDQSKKLPQSLTPSLSFECVKAKLSRKPELSPIDNSPGEQDLASFTATDYNNVVNIAQEHIDHSLYLATPPDHSLALATPPDHSLSLATPPDHSLSLATPPVKNLFLATPPDMNSSLATPSNHNPSLATPPDHNLSTFTPPDHNLSLATPPDQNPYLATPPVNNQSQSTPSDHNLSISTPTDHEISPALDHCGQNFAKCLAKGKGDLTLLASPAVMKSAHVTTSSQVSPKKVLQHSIANVLAHGDTEGPAPERGDVTSVMMTVLRDLVEMLSRRMVTLNTSFGALLEIGETNKDLEVVVRISGTRAQVRQTYWHVQQLVDCAGLSSSDA